MWQPFYSISVKIPNKDGKQSSCVSHEETQPGGRMYGYFQNYLVCFIYGWPKFVENGSDMCYLLFWTCLFLCKSRLAYRWSQRGSCPYMGFFQSKLFAFSVVYVVIHWNGVFITWTGRYCLIRYHICEWPVSEKGWWVWWTFALTYCGCYCDLALSNVGFFTFILILAESNKL